MLMRKIERTNYPNKLLLGYNISRASKKIEKKALNQKPRMLKIYLGDLNINVPKGDSVAHV